jgi:hypothetical protein
MDGKMRPETSIVMVFTLLCGAADPAEPDSGPPGKRIVFFGGVKTHGPGAHEHLKGV